jgi:hypothetical protein
MYSCENVKFHQSDVSIIHASPGSALIECHQLLALLETPELFL